MPIQMKVGSMVTSAFGTGLSWHLFSLSEYEEPWPQPAESKDKPHDCTLAFQETQCRVRRAHQMRCARCTPYLTNIPSTVQGSIRERPALALSPAKSRQCRLLPARMPAGFRKVTRHKSALPWRMARGFRYEVLLLPLPAMEVRSTRRVVPGRRRRGRMAGVA